MDNRDWMYNRTLRHGYLSDDFVAGVQTFINFATSHPECMSDGLIKCPCRKYKCSNKQYLPPDVVHYHIFKNGFVENYKVWTFHGETTHWDFNVESTSTTDNQFPRSQNETDYENQYFSNWWGGAQQMVHDAAGPSYVHSMPQDHPNTQEFIPEPPNQEAQRFYDMMKMANEPLWQGEGSPGKHSQLSASVRMLEMKSNYGFSEGMFNEMSQFLQEILPEGNTMPHDYYQTKKLVSGLGLPVEVIHCCTNNCMLYWRADDQLTSCKFCGQPRYKSRDGTRGKRTKQKLSVPLKKMHYFPLISRLKKLYASSATADEMTWHATHKKEEGKMCHPSDSPAWQHFDMMYPNFSSEKRNVRLGLCTDGFQPFGPTGKQYSLWPVILTPYNLPPGLCMRDEFMMLSCLVPGPRNPKQSIDVFLQPLIAELNLLWSQGVETYDVATQTNFTMRAALIWTINDFPAYGMLSGWSTAGRLACPHCMGDSDAFTLPHSGKQSWFDNHRKFLPLEHPYRRNRNDFRNRQQVHKPPPPIVTGAQLLSEISRLRLLKMTMPDAEAVNSGICRNNVGCGWKKRSILWDLPYWSTLLIRHNLDVMHVEKNVFDNLFNTIMNIPNKTKDTKKSRDELQGICKRPHLEFNPSTGRYPKASYVIDKEGKKIIFDWVKQLRFPDGYASNLGRCVDEHRLRMFGMKSHDCHVFMQRLLPIVTRDFLPKEIWEPITELCCFFKELTVTNLSEDRIAQLHRDIPLILCKLERIFPPSFFDSMEHLPVHLGFEAQIAGPVHYRWMYPFERYLHGLKKKIKNKHHVEGSISTGYIGQEVAKFASYYFAGDAPTINRSLHRNEVHLNDLDENEPDRLQVFKTNGRPLGASKRRNLIANEYHAAHLYVLLNCVEIEQYVDTYKEELSSRYPHDELTYADIEQHLEQEFPLWFNNKVLHSYWEETNEFIRSLAWGPLTQVRTFRGYYVGGYKFEADSDDNHRPTNSSGVCVKGSNYSSDDSDFFGVLKEVIELEYPALPMKRCVLFKCDWFDPVIGRGVVVHPRFNIVDINITRKYKKYEPFVLAAQATQVFFCSYPRRRWDRAQWWTVCKVKARSELDMPESSSTNNVADAPLQEDITELDNPLSITNHNEYIELADNFDINSEDVFDEIEENEEDEFDETNFSDGDSDESLDLTSTDDE